MKTIDILSREDIKEIINKKLEECISDIYKRLDKIRIRLSDIENILKLSKDKLLCN